MTEIILLVICILLSVLTLTLTLLLLARSRKSGDAVSAETLRRIEEKTTAAGNLVDYNVRATENLSRATETRLNNIQSPLA